MNKIIVSIILLGLSLALLIGSVVPVSYQIKQTGQTAFDSVKNMNTSIKP